MRAERRRRQAGFTLLELLIAIVVFALIIIPTYGWMSNLLNQVDYSNRRAERLADLQLAWQVLQRDLEQLVDRGIRNEFGDPVAALVGGSGFTGVEFTRGGRPNPAGYRRSELQRVAYMQDNDRLVRRTWRVLDRAQDSLPDEQLLVGEVVNFSMRFLDQSRKWQTRWPPAQQQAIQGGEAGGLPQAVEVQLELEDLGKLVWQFRLPQPFVATAAAPLDEGGGGDGEGGAGPDGEGAGGEPVDGDGER